MIDLDELRGLARETGSDNGFYAPADEDNAAMLYEAADEIERLRASELALKRELLDQLIHRESKFADHVTGWSSTEKEALSNFEIRQRIMNLEAEIQESGS